MEQQRDPLPPYGGMFWPGMEEEEAVPSPAAEQQPIPSPAPEEKEPAEEQKASEEVPYELPELSAYLEFFQGLAQLEERSEPSDKNTKI